MGRLALLLLFLAACPPKAKDAELEPLGSDAPPPSGRSVTKIDDGEDADSDGDGGLRGKLAQMGAENDGAGKTTTKPAPVDAGAGRATATADAALYGGNGSPPYIDNEGRVRGPGGPVFMGKGPECNAERDHCLREGVWFAVDNLVAGKMYRAMPIFEYEKKWYTWRGKEHTFAKRFKTKVGTKDTLRPGDPVIWLIDENAANKFLDNEYDALTSSRWVAGVIDGFVGSDRIRVKGWTYGTVPIDTTRVVIDTQ